MESITPATRLQCSTMEDWARFFIRTESLAVKSTPPPMPSVWQESADAIDLSPGRPTELSLTRKLPQSVKLSQLRDPDVRAQVMHKFWHHELSAAELMAWAILRFPSAPEKFKKGLAKIARDELRHMKLYENYLLERGYRLGTFPIRDWLWERVQFVESPLQFVALLGIGFEGANLDHAERFERMFRESGDLEAAGIQAQVGREEVPHVRFAAYWFESWTGGLDFSSWREQLPSDLGPNAVQGKVLSKAARQKANLSPNFLHELREWRRS
ncbi:MAG: ferritin-like domain-containing protein [Polyangiaceae bacterium]|nr:ferritin-like domain-containing protein [Polyangiaceae bacterium]